MIEGAQARVSPRRLVQVPDRSDHQSLPLARPPTLFRPDNRMDRQALGEIAGASVETFDHCGKGRVGPLALFSDGTQQYGRFSVYPIMESTDAGLQAMDLRFPRCRRSLERDAI